MNRWKAGLTHFLLSCAVAGLVYMAVRYFWYPGPLFEVAGGLQLLLVIISVDVTLGPLVTLIVFKPGKPGLTFDLWFIGILQVGALAFGLLSIAESRPVFITFVKDRFELVRAAELADADLAKAAPEYASLPWFGYRLAGARIPKKPAEQMALLDAALGGKDIQYHPQYYVDYREVAPEAAKRAAPISQLRALNPDSVAEIDSMVARIGPESRLGFLPMRAGKSDMTVVVMKSGGQVLALLPLRPWDY